MISVITPFHNTAPELFKRTVDSMSMVSTDKSFLEWVIIFHNCDDEHMDVAKELLDGCSIKAVSYVLSNNEHVPSSPRNYGLSKATGEYVYFLDSDDCIEPGFLEKAYAAAKEQSAEIVIAGAAAKSVDAGVMPLPMPLLLYSKDGIFNIDNTKYVYDDGGIKKRRNREILGRLIYGAPMFLGTKLIKKELIDRNNLTFDTELEFLEDVFFETSLYSLAEKITVLTDEVAYTYIQRTGSTVQSLVSKQRDSAEGLIRPVRKIVDLCEKEDIDHNLFLWSIFEMYGSTLLRAQLSPVIQADLKNKVAEYVTKLRPIPYVGRAGEKELLSMKFLADIFVDQSKRVYEQDRVNITFQSMVGKMKSYSGTAVVTDDGSITYGELWERSERLAGAVISRTSAMDLPKDKAAVGIYMDNSIQRLVALIAILKSGNPFVTLSKHNTQDRLTYITDVSGVSLIVTDENEFDPKALLGKEIASIVYEEAVNCEDNSLAAGTTLRDDLPLVIEFTSGSEGNPKGVLFSRRNFVNFLYHFEGNKKNCYQAKVSDTYIVHMEIDFLFGLLVSLEALLFGKKICLLKEPRDINSEFVKNCIAFDKGVSISAVPSVADEWFSRDDLKGMFKNIGLLVYGGEGVKKEQIERARCALKEGAVIYSGYATTETGPIVDGVVDEHDIDSGIPQADVSVSIIDEDGNPLPTGEKGRVCIRGFRVSQGYIGGNNDDFIIDRSGLNTFISRDEGYIKTNGRLAICGRLDRMIKHRGVRIDPSEIEKALLSFGGIENVAAKAFDASGICCFYTADKKLDEFELRSFLAEKIPYYMMPETFCYMDKMPVTARGKLDYKSLELPRERDAHEAEKDDTPGSLGTVMKCFAGEFSEIKVEAHDNFFYLGGDSIRALKLSVQLTEMGLNVGIQDIFTYPTPLLLARAIDENKLKAKEPESAGVTGEEGYINDTGRDEYDTPPVDDAVYAYEVTGITKGYYTMPVQYREGYRYALRIQYTTTEAMDGDVIRQRVRAAVARHPMLRTEFMLNDSGDLFGLVKRDIEVDVTYRDISGYKEDAKSRYIDGFWHVMDEENHMFSVACFKTGAAEHEVLVRMTHMVADAMGSSIILKELNGEINDNAKEDDFIRCKMQNKRHMEKDIDAAMDFFAEYLKGAQPAATDPPFGMVKENTRVIRRFVKLDKEKQQIVRNRCALLGISFENYIQYEYGRALCEALGQDRIIFRCTFAGRNAGNLDTVANFFTILPVVIAMDMSAGEFSESIFRLGNYSFLDVDTIGRKLRIPFGALGTAEGINSNIMESALTGENITAAKQVIWEDLKGKRMYMEGDTLVIELSYYDNDKTDRVYKAVEEKMRKVLEQA